MLLSLFMLTDFLVSGTPLAVTPKRAAWAIAAAARRACCCKCPQNGGRRG